MGLFTVYGADSTLTIESEEDAAIPIPTVVETLETEMIGRFGLGLGYQYFIRDDFAITVGLEGRYTEINVIDPPLAAPYEEDGVTSLSGTEIFVPGDVLQFQGTIGGRYWLPVRWGSQCRLRPFLGFDLNYIPETNFDVVATILDVPPSDSFPALVLQDSFEFKGSSYWTLGLCLGLSYQWSDSVVMHLTVFHEEALSLSEGVNTLNVQFPPEIPLVIPPLSTTTSVDSRGWIGFLSVSWGF
jgi:hypothetical protein